MSELMRWPPQGTVTAKAGSDEALLQAWAGHSNASIQDTIAVMQRVLRLRTSVMITRVHRPSPSTTEQPQQPEQGESS